MFSEEKLSQTEQKNQKCAGIKSFYSNIPYGLIFHKTKNHSRKDLYLPNASEF